MDSEDVVELVACLAFGMVCVRRVGGSTEDKICFSLFELFLAFLQTSGSPFSSKRSVGRRFRGPRTILGSDKSRTASDLLRGMSVKSSEVSCEGEKVARAMGVHKTQNSVVDTAR